MINELIRIANKAGKEILDIYNSGEFETEHKKDQSPLTQADKQAHQIILSELQTLTPNIPIISEENEFSIPFTQRRLFKQFWLVDPLDGTKEFLKRNGEFTVNIALIEDNYPKWGVINAPALNTIFYSNGFQSFKLGVNESAIRIQASSQESVSVITGSRSHAHKYEERIVQQTQAISKPRGSSLKFCSIAEGAAQLYPRFNPTMEWDTAAGQAIVEAAGGLVLDLQGDRLSYNKKLQKHQGFICYANQKIKANVDKLDLS